MTLAPIVLFVYNRPDHTLQTLESLMNNDLADQSELFINCDGPKEGATAVQLAKIQAVRKVIRLKQWCGKVTITELEKNQTHPVNVVTRVTEIVNLYKKIIVLEDDLVLGKGFLKYMNEALDLYENQSQVMHIAGHLYPVLNKNLPETFFLRFVSCWGWATWKRAWDQFIHDPAELLDKLPKEEIKYFDVDSSYNFYTSLKLCASGSWKFWDIRWYASVFIKKGLVLFPHKSLVRNIGHDGSGMHSPDSYVFSNQSIIDYVNVLPKELIESQAGKLAMKKIFLRIHGSHFFSFTNFKNMIRKVLSPGLYNYLKTKKNELLMSKANSW